MVDERPSCMAEKVVQLVTMMVSASTCTSSRVSGSPIRRTARGCPQREVTRTSRGPGWGCKVPTTGQQTWQEGGMANTKGDTEVDRSLMSPDYASSLDGSPFGPGGLYG